MSGKLPLAVSKRMQAQADRDWRLCSQGDHDTYFRHPRHFAAWTGRACAKMQYSRPALVIRPRIFTQTPDGHSSEALCVASPRTSSVEAPVR